LAIQLAAQASCLAIANAYTPNRKYVLGQPNAVMLHRFW
jgi:hypothetical protein